MARKNTLNRYLAGTPYAVLSMEALEADAIENIQLSLENELVKVNALIEQLGKINRQKGMTREIALSLESIDDGILPFKPVGFTAFPSKTGLTMTQESLGKVISEGFKRAMTFLMELLKRFGALLTSAVGLEPRAKKAAAETKDIVTRYRAAKNAAAVTVSMKFETAEGGVIFIDGNRSYPELLARAGTAEIFYQILSAWKAHCQHDFRTIQGVLRNFYGSGGNASAIEEITKAASERTDSLVRIIGRRGVEANPSESLDTFKKSYFESLERVALSTAGKKPEIGALELAVSFETYGRMLAIHTEVFNRAAEEVSKSNQDIQRQITRLMSTASDVETELFTNMNKVIAIHTRMVAVLATHLSYLVQTHEAYNRKAQADLERAKTEGGV